MATRISNSVWSGYRIKHHDESAWTEIPFYPSSVTGSDNLVSRSFNDAYGNFVDTLVAAKVKVNWIFEGQATATKAEDFFKDFIRNKIHKISGDTGNSYGTRFFDIETWCPGFGYIRATVYLGTPTTFNSEGAAAGNRGAITNFELHWIEVGDSTTYIGGPTIQGSGGNAQ